MKMNNAFVVGNIWLVGGMLHTVAWMGWFSIGLGTIYLIISFSMQIRGDLA